MEGCLIAFRRWGDPAQPGLLLVHGGGAHSRWWDHIAPFFSGRCCVTALDLSGHGDSGRRPSYDLEVWGREIAAVAGLGRSSEPPVVVGHSLGGMATFCSAAEFGDRFEGVIIVDSPVRGLTPEETASLNRQAFGPLRLYPTREHILGAFRTVPEQPIVLPYVVDHVAAHSIRQVPGGWTWKFDPSFFFSLRGIDPDGAGPDTVPGGGAARRVRAGHTGHRGADVRDAGAHGARDRTSAGVPPCHVRRADRAGHRRPRPAGRLASLLCDERSGLTSQGPARLFSLCSPRSGKNPPMLSASPGPDDSVRRPNRIDLLAGVLIACSVILHVVAMFPTYFAGPGDHGSLASQPDQAALYAVLAAGWALVLVIGLTGPARMPVAAGVAVGLAATELGFRITDLGYVARYGTVEAGAGLWLMTAAWVVGAAGAVVAAVAAVRRSRPEPAGTTDEPSVEAHPARCFALRLSFCVVVHSRVRAGFLGRRTGGRRGTAGRDHPIHAGTARSWPRRIRLA